MSIVTDLVSGLTAPIAGLVSEFIVDKDKAAELTYKINTLAVTQAHEIDLAQLAVNQKEAQHPSLFVSGWRPAVGWICALAMLVEFLLVPMAGPFIEVYMAPVKMWHLDMATMLPVLFGLLGLGGMRSYEKVKGVHRR